MVVLSCTSYYTPLPCVFADSIDYLFGTICLVLPHWEEEKALLFLGTSFLYLYYTPLPPGCHPELFSIFCRINHLFGGIIIRLGLGVLFLFVTGLVSLLSFVSLPSL